MNLKKMLINFVGDFVRDSSLRIKLFLVIGFELLKVVKWYLMVFGYDVVVVYDNCF